MAGLVFKCVLWNDSVEFLDYITVESYSPLMATCKLVQKAMPPLCHYLDKSSCMGFKNTEEGEFLKQCTLKPKYICCDNSRVCGNHKNKKDKKNLLNVSITAIMPKIVKSELEPQQQQV